MSYQFEPFGEVPEWNTDYPSLSEATPEQKKFYNLWLKQFEKGAFIDIKGNISYVFVYLYSVIERFIRDKNINYILGCFEQVKNGYSKYQKIRDCLTHWTFEACLYINDYDKAWEVGKGKHLKVSDIINFRAKCRDTSIDGQDLLCILGSNNGLTKFGKNHQEQIAKLASIFLNDFHKEHGKNLIEYFCRQFDFSNLTEDNFSQLKEFYPTEKEFFLWKKIHESNKERDHYTYRHYPLGGEPKPNFLATKSALLQGYLLGGVPGSGASVSCKPWIECESIPCIITVALTNEGKRILRECENTVREEKIFPKLERVGLVKQSYSTSFARYFQMKK